ncbi:MAG: STAS domain-containing protein [Acidimicrobiales bacterium]|nr:STAS domain-containing protein [Acidimicrobiales bacterium]MCB9372363.1 STAS domain-containing protein [Microthrixaceae bacterium]
MTDGRLTIEAQTDGAGTILVLDGEVDPHTTEQLDGAIDEAFTADARLVLDLRGVTFIDSAGLRSLIRAQRRADDADGSLVLRAPRPSTLRVLEITGLTDELTVEAASDATG